MTVQVGCCDYFSPGPQALSSAPNMASTWVLNDMHYCKYDDLSSLAERALSAIQNRGSYEVYEDVILVCKAINNSLKTPSSPSGTLPIMLPFKGR